MQQAFGFQRGQRFIPTAKAGGFRAVFCGKSLPPTPFSLRLQSLPKRNTGGGKDQGEESYSAPLLVRKSSTALRAMRYSPPMRAAGSLPSSISAMTSNSEIRR